MQYKDIITIVISVCTFLLGGTLVYWRENRKSFQEKIFEYKYAAYKEIIEQIGMYHQDIYSLLAEYQEFEGTKEEWMQKNARIISRIFPQSKRVRPIIF